MSSSNGRWWDLLLEMGKGFAFIGNQHHLEIGGQDWYVDPLFHHRRVHCLVAVDLKMDAFQAEHAGKDDAARGQRVSRFHRPAPE